MHKSDHRVQTLHAIPKLKKVVQACKCLVVLDGDQVQGRDNAVLPDLERYRVSEWGVHVLIVTGRWTAAVLVPQKKPCSWMTNVRAYTQVKDAADMSITYIMSSLMDDIRCKVLLVSSDSFILVLQNLLLSAGIEAYAMKSDAHIPAFLLRRVLAPRSHILASAMSKVTSSIPESVSAEEYESLAAAMLKRMYIPSLCSTRIASMLAQERRFSPRGEKLSSPPKAYTHGR